jgi:oligoribonuclease
MQYLSIDIETSGLDREKNQILSIGAIFEDTKKQLSFEEIPKFHAAILHEEIKGSFRAISINADLISLIADYRDCKTPEARNEITAKTGISFFREEEVVQNFFNFLCDCGLSEERTMSSQMKPLSINCAGKNFGTFDKLFLEKLPRWQQAIRIRQRILDPSILFVDWKEDLEIPNLSTCKRRAGMNEVVTHNALEDAWDVIQLMRKFYQNKTIEYENFL